MSKPKVDAQARNHSGELFEIFGGRLRLAPRKAPGYLSVDRYDVMTKPFENVRGNQAPRPSGTIYRDPQSLARWLVSRKQRSSVLIEDFRISCSQTKLRRVLSDLHSKSPLHPLLLRLREFHPTSIEQFQARVFWGVVRSRNRKTHGAHSASCSEGGHGRGHQTEEQRLTAGRVNGSGHGSRQQGRTLSSVPPHSVSTAAEDESNRLRKPVNLHRRLSLVEDPSNPSGPEDLTHRSLSLDNLRPELRGGLSSQIQHHIRNLLDLPLSLKCSPLPDDMHQTLRGHRHHQLRLYGVRQDIPRVLLWHAQGDHVLEGLIRSLQRLVVHFHGTLVRLHTRRCDEAFP